MRKPVYGIGGPITDSDFNVVHMNRKKAQAYADKLARKTVSSGWSSFAKGFVFDSGEYYRVSVCVSNPRKSL